MSPISSYFRILIIILSLVPGLLRPALSSTIGNSPQSTLELTEIEKTFLKNLAPLRVPLITHQPPLSYKDNGQEAGYLNALLELVASRLDIQYSRTSEYSYAESIQALKQGKVNLLNDYSSYNKTSKFIEHTRPVMTIPFVAVGRLDGDTSISSVNQLTDKTLVLVNGFQQTKTIQNRYPALDIILVDSIDQAYRALRNKEADLYIDNAVHAGFYLHSQMISDLQIQGELHSKEMGLLKLRFAVRKDQPLLLSIIQKALNSISQSEIYNLRKKWLINHPAQTKLALTADERLWLTNHPQIRLASDNAWLPFERINKKGVYEGIAADYMKLVEQRLGMKFIISPIKPWKEITQMVSQKELDLFTLAMETEPRKKYTIFTKPYISHPMIIVTKNNIGYVDGLKGLKGKTVAIENGYASFDLLSNNHPDLKLQPYPDSLSAVLAVSNGSAFAYIGNIANLSHIIRTHGITNTKISGQVPYSFDLAMGVRNDWPELVPILQKALNSITLEEKNTILQKWIGIETKQKFDYTLLWQITGLLLILFLVTIYWNLSLKKKVRDRTLQLEYQAHFDALTDLPNRILALDRLNQLINESKRTHQQAALLFLDLDDFKKINDTMGHDNGDQILIDAAIRLKATLRASDTVARLGGDEFIILLSGLNDARDSSPVAENLIDKFRTPFTLDDRELILTASIGIAVYPGDGTTPEVLLKNADSAMYSSKKQGRNTYTFYNETMNLEVTRNLLLEEHMHNALSRDEFTILYQPKVNIKSRQIMGVEALLRWHNPVLGDISPLEFIPIAEHNGMIVPIGQYVLKKSLEVATRWQKDHGLSLSIAVNMSPRQFRDPELVSSFSNIINKSGIHKASVEIEITEGVLMSGHSIVEAALSSLKQLGISLAMDDFGTGYSSLNYLRKYPFDVLKIDREFIRDVLNDKSGQALVDATINMAHALGLKVVAEGVETEEQLNFLASKGCDCAQGYLFSRPVTEQELGILLNRNSI